MSEKPQKRLVSQGRYARLITKRTALTLGSVVSLGVGLVTLVGSVISFWTAFYNGSLLVPSTCMLTTIHRFCISAGMFFAAFRFYKNEQKVERVVPITKRSSHLLPPEETLVRPSDLSPSQQQAELLRAAPQGSETPAEELLRATANRQGD